MQSPNEDVATLYDNFEASVRTFGRRPCLGTRLVGAEGEAGPYSWETYEEVRTVYVYPSKSTTCVEAARKRERELFHH